MGQVLAKIGQFIIHTICDFLRNSVLNGKRISQATLPAEEVKEPLITTQDSNVILIIAEDEVQDQSSGTDKIIFEYSCSNSSNNDEIVEDKEVAITVSPNEILAYNGCDNCISNVDGNTVNCAEGKTQSINVVVKPKKIQDKWFMHYCSSHKILLVGEGDFSFSVCLAKAFGSASNMVATSLDSLGFLMVNYPSAVSNIGYLRKRGCSVVHEVDVTDDLDLHPLVYMHAHEYDRIIFNFPLAGFFRESRKQALKRNRRLVRLFFEQARC